MLQVVSPYDLRIIKEIPLAQKGEVDKALSIAYHLFQDKSQWISAYERIAILERTAEIMKTRIVELTKIAAEEGGKPFADSKVEVLRAINGVKLVCGGKRISNTCFAPTVLFNPPGDARVSREEIFGPVICIYPYSNRDNAIEIANSLDVHFQASVFTQNINAALDSVRNLNATAVMINDHTAFRVDWMPFGGRDTSGIGMGGIHYSMSEMTREKLVVIKSKTL